jgi:hypothetical protein
MFHFKEDEMNKFQRRLMSLALYSKLEGKVQKKVCKGWARKHPVLKQKEAWYAVDNVN